MVKKKAIQTHLNSLEKCEDVVRRNIEYFLEAGNALAVIRENFSQWGLKAKFKSFESYCKEKWSITSRRAGQLIASAKVVESAKVGTIVPTSEGQARELAKVPEEDREEVMEEASEAAGGKPTAKDIKKAAVAKYKNAVAPAKRKTPVEIAKGQEHQLTGLQKEIQKFRKTCLALSEEPIGRFLHQQSIDTDLRNVWVALKFARPFAPCPYCSGDGCKVCLESGWLPKTKYENVPSELKK